MTKTLADMRKLSNWESSERRLIGPNFGRERRRFERSIDLGEDIGVYRLVPQYDGGYSVMLNVYTPVKGSHWVTIHNHVNTATQGLKLAYASALRIRA